MIKRMLLKLGKSGNLEKCLIARPDPIGRKK